MLFCPPNISFTTVWYQGGFSTCFIETLTGIILGFYMLIFGNGELALYWRYGTPIDRLLLRPRPKLYVVQLVLNAILILLPFVWLALRVWQQANWYGYSVFYNVVGCYVWIMSFSLIALERNCDLPSTPGRGHSVLLNVFWAMALAFDSLNFVNFNGDAWYFVVHDAKDRALLAVFIIKWICTAAVFVIGMIAPGMISFESRSQFFYRPLRESSNAKYGSTSSVETSLESRASTDLVMSMELLREQLYNGDLVLSFRQLPRQNAGATVDAAQQAENVLKNRYTNVLPYDFNRVLLQRRGGPAVDYINASHIVVRLPGSSTEKRYIAAQGPLEATSADFWQMIWDQKAQTIVMLTDLHEGGLSKCYQYWPDVNESSQYNNRLVVSCLRVDETRHSAAVVREFSLIDVVSQTELEVVHLQYRGWPDYGAPKKPQVFLDFVELIRVCVPEPAASASAPIVTHCSAGIGRTGVYIMVEALMQQIDRRLPVRPLEIIQHLRGQRMGMLQTEEQLVFACETALRYYDRRRRT